MVLNNKVITCNQGCWATFVKEKDEWKLVSCDPVEMRRKGDHRIFVWKGRPCGTWLYDKSLDWWLIEYDAKGDEARMKRHVLWPIGNDKYALQNFDEAKSLYESPELWKGTSSTHKNEFMSQRIVLCMIEFPSSPTS